VVIMTSNYTHTPVLMEETLTFLRLREGGSYIDCTTGLGGHSERIAAAIGPEGRLLCIDQDRDALEFARAKLAPFGRRVSFAHGNFRELAELAGREGFSGVDGILMDLGISSMQIQRAERGFAFGLEGPLDMRMDRSGEGLTAGEIINTWDEVSLADLFFTYGEERQSRRIAAAIVKARPLQTTWDLARTVEQVAGGARGRTQIHPATKVFLALRIRVNGELDSLNAALPLACNLLGSGNPATPGGRLVVISFHSLEDRIVKQYFRRESTDCICPPGLPVCRCGHKATLRDLTHRAVKPGEAEIASNPRARSAVLRCVERIG
jgi:16S rRNA (cytosine1402-N4)-methyltransferase